MSMIIFRYTAAEILDGSKTRTTRTNFPYAIYRALCKTGWKISGDEYYRHISDEHIREANQLMETLGGVRVTWTDARGAPMIGYLRVLSVQRIKLYQMDENMAREEAVKPRPREDTTSYLESFAGLWDEIHPQPGFCWQDNPVVWTFTFRRDDDDGHTGDDSC